MPLLLTRSRVLSLTFTQHVWYAFTGYTLDVFTTWFPLDSTCQRSHDATKRLQLQQTFPFPFYLHLRRSVQWLKVNQSKTSAKKSFFLCWSHLVIPLSFNKIHNSYQTFGDLWTPGVRDLSTRPSDCITKKVYSSPFASLLAWVHFLV